MNKIFLLSLLAIIISCSSTHRINLVSVGKKKTLQVSKVTTNQEKLPNILAEPINTNLKESGNKLNSTSLEKNITYGAITKKIIEDSPSANKNGNKSVNSKVSLKPKVKSEQILADHPVSHQRKKNDANAWLLLFGVVMSATIAGVIVKNKTQAKMVSQWASMHKWQARGLITGIKLILGVSGLYVGKIMFEADLLISEEIIYSGLGLFALTALTYPIKNASNKFFNPSYLKRKMHDVVLSMNGLLLMVSVGNISAADKDFLSPVSSMFQATDDFLSARDHSRDFIASGSSKQMSTSIKPSWIKNIDESNEKSMFIKILLTILTLILIAALLFLLVMISCSLSCNGHDALAVVVAVLGGAGILALLVTLLYQIWRKPKVTEPAITN